ncbi:MAG: hypothetical protein ABSB11_02260 [Sedimentisphaerales bacterium]|jgi:hypothetical protein
MTTKGIFRCVVVTGIFCGLFAWGCEKQAQTVQTGPAESKSPAQPQKQLNGPAKIALKSSVGELDKYKITTIARRTTKWQGPVPDKAAFDEALSEERVEMTVTRRIQTVDANGIATAKVSIDKLKCSFSSKGQATLDFDSTRGSDSKNPLIQLIGQTYIIEFNPQNIVSFVDELPPVTIMMKGDTVSDKVGHEIVLPDSIIERHSTIQLPKPGQEMLKPGGKWSSIKTFMFGKMGIKSYEKIYTLKELRNNGGREIAVIDMNAIPTSEVEPKYAGKKAEEGASQKFDSKELYTGAGEFDVKAGRIENYNENLQATWTVALPGKQGDTSEPVVLNMSAERGYGIERIK